MSESQSIVQWHQTPEKAGRSTRAAVVSDGEALSVY